MSVYWIAVHRTIHTCPADPAPHTIDTKRTIMAISDGGPCLRPVMVKGIATACSRIARSDKQCPACKTQVHVNSTQYTDLGYQGPVKAPHEVAA